MEFKETHKKISLAAVAAGLFYLGTNPEVIALIPAPWGMLLSKFLIGSGLGGVLFNMDPKKGDK